MLDLLLSLLYILSIGSQDSGMGELRIIPRSDWGAREPKEIQALPHPVPKIILHHSSMGDNISVTLEEGIKLVKEIQDFHMDNRGWSDVGYSFLIGEDGTMYEGRGWDRIGAHSLGNNAVSIGICLMGNFNEKLPSEAQMEATKRLIAYGVDNNYIQENYSLFGHRDVRNGTDCPGHLFYKEMSTWPNKAVATPQEIF